MIEFLQMLAGMTIVAGFLYAALAPINGDDINDE